MIELELIIDGDFVCHAYRAERPDRGQPHRLYRLFPLRRRTHRASRRGILCDHSICPTPLSDRPLVVRDSSFIRDDTLREHRVRFLTLDGQRGIRCNHDLVRISRAKELLKLIHRQRNRILRFCAAS